MNRLLATVRSFFADLFWPPKAEARPAFTAWEPEAVLPPIAEEPIEVKPRKARKVRAEEDDRADHTFGIWTHLGDVLDQLKDYFDALKVFRKGDPDSYGLYARVGGQILPDRALLDHTELSASWRTGYRPSFGLIHFSRSQASIDESQPDPIIPARLIYFKKMERRSWVQATKGELYEVNAFYIYKGHPHRMIFHIGVDPDGNLHVLRELHNKAVHLPGRRRDWFLRREWNYPSILDEWAADVSKHRKETITRDDLAAGFFKLLVNTCEFATAGAQVRVGQGKITARFNVDILRVPYFFKNRNRTYNENGNSKRIFHIVRTHYRKDKPIKTHFRGEREFDWHGYHVHVSMPGWHHADLVNFQGSALEETNLDPSHEWLSSARAGVLFAKHMEGKR